MFKKIKQFVRTRFEKQQQQHSRRWSSQGRGCSTPKPTSSSTNTSNGTQNEVSFTPSSLVEQAASMPAPDVMWNHLENDLLSTKGISKDDFIVIKDIGQGTFAKVVLVQKIDTGKFYAMKVIDKIKMLQHGRIRDLFNERNVLKASKHPFIVKLRYSFQSRHQLFFVMDFMSGGDLLSYLDHCPEGRLSENLARFYAAEIFLALTYLHDNGIIYRDLKPSNVLLDDRGHVRLADMGLCKVFNPEAFKSEAPAVYRCRSFVGSPAYVAPEIICHKKYGSAVDWWSFGVFLFRMLCGDIPFKGPNVQKMFENILYAPVDFTPYPWVSADAQNLIFGLLRKHEERRLSTAEILAHPFFAGIDWSKMMTRSIDPPGNLPASEFVKSDRASPSPNSLSDDDLSVNLERSEQPAGAEGGPGTDASPQTQLSSPSQSISSSKQRMFDGFTFVGDLSRGESTVVDATIDPTTGEVVRTSSGGREALHPSKPGQFDANEIQERIVQLAIEQQLDVSFTEQVATGCGLTVNSVPQTANEV